jgi:hypothetical protein
LSERCSSWDGPDGKAGFPRKACGCVDEKEGASFASPPVDLHPKPRLQKARGKDRALAAETVKRRGVNHAGELRKICGWAEERGLHSFDTFNLS